MGAVIYAGSRSRIGMEGYTGEYGVEDGTIIIIYP